MIDVGARAQQTSESDLGSGDRAGEELIVCCSFDKSRRMCLMKLLSHEAWNLNQRQWPKRHYETKQHPANTWMIRTTKLHHEHEMMD